MPAVNSHCVTDPEVLVDIVMASTAQNALPGTKIDINSQHYYMKRL